MAPMPEKSRARYPNTLAAPGHRASLSQGARPEMGSAVTSAPGVKAYTTGRSLTLWLGFRAKLRAYTVWDWALTC